MKPKRVYKGKPFPSVPESLRDKLPMWRWRIDRSRLGLWVSADTMRGEPDIWCTYLSRLHKESHKVRHRQYRVEYLANPQPAPKYFESMNVAVDYMLHKYDEITGW